MKMLIKNIVSQSRILKPLKHFQRNKVIIFNYHRICGDSCSTLFDESLIGPTGDRFKKEMEWLKKETRILSESELLDIIYNDRPMNEICSMVTFDDGYRDNFDIAYPILKKLEIPATFFIPTFHITERKVGWWDIVAYFFKKTNKKFFNFNGEGFHITDTDSLIQKFILEIKSMESFQVEDYLHRLSFSLNVTMPEIDLQSSELMTWDEIKLMSDNGMSIGSHSHDHSILSRQDDITLREQLKKSIDLLESNLGKKINSIAYPVGGYDHFNNSTMTISKNLGFKLGFSYLTGINNRGLINPFDVKRVSMDPDWINLDLPLAFPGHYFNKT